MSPKPLLEIRGLSTHFPSSRGTVHAVSGVSLSVAEGEITGVVGESGCGKSALLLSVMRLVPFPGRVVTGSVVLDGVDLMGLSHGAMREVRGRRIAMVFQDPMTTLNPAHSVGDQIAESLIVHGLEPTGGRRALRSYGVDLMREVGISQAETRYDSYPHQFSGGMQQRVMIAIALACRPQVLLADEPTTSLDVTIQAQVLELMRSINRGTGTAIVIVTHDLMMAGDFCDNIAVMYAGRVVECGPAGAIVDAPLHPYAQALLSSMPRLGNREALKPIPGEVPDLHVVLPGCAFAPRCSKQMRQCLYEEPALEPANGCRKVACHLLNPRPEISLP